MLFLMENAHCATAGDTEQNGAKHFTVARRGIVTCFRHVMIVFAGIWRKTQNRNVLCEKFESLFLWRTKHVSIRVFPCKCQQINRLANRVRAGCEGNRMRGLLVSF